MTPSTVALSGWIVAALAVAAAIAVWRQFVQRMEAVARASHELRGPITAATLGLQQGELSAPRRRALELELGRARLALEDLAAVGSGSKLERSLELVDVRELVADSVEAWRPAAAQRGVGAEMRWSGRPATVLGDRLRLAQAVGNLIANAIEHGGEVVEVRGRGTNDTVRVEVVDRGPGLRAPVSELAARARPRGPRGRGLAIASAIVRNHGGRLAAAPSDRGARLVITLPAADEACEPTTGSGA